MGLETIATIAGLALSAAGTGVGIAGAQQASSNMNKAVAEQIAEQQGLQNQAKPIYQQNLQASSPQKAQQTLADTMQQTLGQYKAAAAAPVSTQPFSTTPPSNQVSAATQADVNRQQQASAALQGYPQLQTNWNVANTNTNNQLGNIGTIAQILSSAFPTNLAAAQTSGNTLGGIGSLLGTAGSVGAAYGSQYNNQQGYSKLLKLLQAQGGTNPTAGDVSGPNI